METSGTQQVARRRSLLSIPSTKAPEQRFSLWKSLLISYAIIFMVALGWHLISGYEISLEVVGEILAITLGFTTPIASLAYLTIQLVRKRGSHLSTFSRRALLVLGWMISGMVGALIGWTILYAVGIIGVDTAHSFKLIPFLISDGLIAIIISTFILFFESVGIHFRRRVAWIDQEEMLTSEFRAARSVQQSLLPDEDVHIHGFDISGAMAPAVEVGGDYYDYLSFVDGTKAVLVADAAGKGIPAALVMAKFQGMAQALSLHVGDPVEFFAGLNDTLRSRLDRRSFITVGMLTIGFDDRCEFYRAGHNPMLHYSAASDTVESACPSGIALGLANGNVVRKTIEPYVFTMQTGDVAVIYSDGLNEGVNINNEEFGEEGIRRSLKHAAARGATASQIRAALLNDLADFVGDAPAHDDITVVVIKKV
jgi:serine phosphatase RsbU (regulator of sigma subunit)